MADFGGFMRFKVGSTLLRMRGKFETEPTDSEFKEMTNQDGSVDREQTPSAQKADITFVDTQDSDDTNATPTSIDWNTIMKAGRTNMTVQEDSTGIIHTWTAGMFVGRPKVDRMKGEVTGISIVCNRGNYKQTTAS